MNSSMESLVEVEDFPGRLLHVAALWDNAELLEDLLNGEELQCLNARDSWGRTALHAAATNDNSRWVANLQCSLHPLWLITAKVKLV